MHCELRIACAFCVLALGRVLRMSVGFGLGFVLGVGIYSFDLSSIIANHSPPTPSHTLTPNPEPLTPSHTLTQYAEYAIPHYAIRVKVGWSIFTRSHLSQNAIAIRNTQQLLNTLRMAYLTLMRSSRPRESRDHYWKE